MELKTGYKQTEVGVIPSDWEVKKLGELGKFSKGSGVRKDESLSGDIPCVRYGELYTRHSDYIKQFYSFISKEVSETAKKLKTGDILFAGSGETKEEIGKSVAFIDEFDAYAGGDIVILTPTNVEPLYLGYLLNAPIIQKQKASRGQGDAVVHISAFQLAITSIPLPPTLAEQSAIATALSDTDQYITHLEKLIAKKRNIKQGAMQELLKPKEGWVVKKLGEECEVITKGTTPTSVGRDFQSIGINFIKIESLEQNGKIIQDKVAFIDSHTHSLLKRSQLRSGDLLFSIAGALGRVAMVDDEILPANTNQALAIVRLKKDSEIDLKYLFFFLNTVKVQAHILTISVQGAQANLSLQNISELQIECPLKSEQTHLSTILSDMDAEIGTLETKLSKAKSIKQGMMQQLLTGKIRLL